MPRLPQADQTVPTVIGPRSAVKLALAYALLAGCQVADAPADAPPEQVSTVAGLVLPSAEARPSAETRDGSSDSVVLVSDNGEAGWIAAADRQFGLRIYALDGQEVSAFGVGALRDVDAVRVAADEYVMAASNAATQSINLFHARIADGVLTVTPRTPLPLALAEPHGLCMELVADRLRVYIADGGGRIEEWHVDADGFGSLVRWFSFPTRTEGCVVDRPARRLFVGEAGVGIWSLDLETGDRFLVDGYPSARLLPDAEGLDIYEAGDRRYLLASTPRGQSVGVYRLPSAEPAAAIRVSPNAQLGIDGLPVVGGVAVTSRALPGHPEGIVIFHDGTTYERSFKMVDWRVVELLLEP